jgi:hypothetical protein
MREIKFRAWSDVGQQMYDESCGFDTYAVFQEHKDTPDAIHLMQYTGLQDRNGKEIYEGDLVRYAAHDVLIVEYKAPAFTLRNPNAEDYWQWSVGLEGLGGGHPVDIEVIGNIWDTPELREAES